MALVWIVIAVVVLLFVGLAYLLGGWILSLFLNPILMNFDLNTITPILGASILVLVNIVYSMIRKK